MTTLPLRLSRATSPGTRAQALQVSMLGATVLVLAALLVRGLTSFALILAVGLCVFAVSIWAPALARRAAFYALLLAPFAMVVPLLRPSSYNWLAYATVIGLVALLANIRAQHYITAGMAFLGYALVNAVIFVSFGGSQVTSWRTTLVAPVAALVFYCLALVVTRAEVRKFLGAFLAFAAVESALAISQSLVGWPVLMGQTISQSNRNLLGYVSSAVSTSASQGMGTFEHFNGMGALLALAVPLAFGLWLQRRRSVWRAALLTLLLFGLYVTFSRGSWAGAGLGILVLLLARGSWPRRVQLISVVVIMGVGVATSAAFAAYYNGTQDLTVRTQTWETAVTYASRHPEKLALGYGYSFFQDQGLANSQVQSHRMVSLHSWVVQVPLELGIVGLVLLLLFLVPPLRAALRSDSTPFRMAIAAGIVGFLIGQLVDNSLLGWTGVLMFMLVGLLQRLQLPD